VFAREPNNANAYELMGAMLMQQGRSKSQHSKSATLALKHQCFCSWDLFGWPEHHWANDFEKGCPGRSRNVKSTYRWRNSQKTFDGALSAYRQL